MPPAPPARLLHADEPVEPGIVAVAVIIAFVLHVVAVPATPLTSVANAWGVGRPGRLLVVAVKDYVVALVRGSEL